MQSYGLPSPLFKARAAIWFRKHFPKARRCLSGRAPLASSISSNANPQTQRFALALRIAVLLVVEGEASNLKTVLDGPSRSPAVAK